MKFNKNILYISLIIVITTIIGSYYFFNQSNSSIDNIENFKLSLSKNLNLSLINETIEKNSRELNFEDINKSVYNFKFIKIEEYNFENIYGLGLYKNGDGLLSDLFNEYNYYVLDNDKYNFIEIKHIQNEKFRVKLDNLIRNNFIYNNYLEKILLENNIENSVLNNRFNKKILDFKLYKFGRLNNQKEILYNYEYYNKNNFFLLYIYNSTKIKYDENSYYKIDLGKLNDFNYSILFLNNISKNKSSEIINEFNTIYSFN